VLDEIRVQLKDVEKGQASDPKKLSPANIARLQATNDFSDLGFAYGLSESTMREMIAAARGNEPFAPPSFPGLEPDMIDQRSLPLIPSSNISSARAPSSTAMR
jgi:hypothetical protein